MGRGEGGINKYSGGSKDTLLSKGGEHLAKEGGPPRERSTSRGEENLGRQQGRTYSGI